MAGPSFHHMRVRRCRPIFDFEKNSSKSLQGLWLGLKSRGSVCAPFVTTVGAASQNLIQQLVTTTDRCDRAGAVVTTVPWTAHCRGRFLSSLYR